MTHPHTSSTGCLHPGGAYSHVTEGRAGVHRRLRPARPADRCDARGHRGADRGDPGQRRPGVGRRRARPVARGEGHGAPGGAGPGLRRFQRRVRPHRPAPPTRCGRRSARGSWASWSRSTSSPSGPAVTTSAQRSCGPWSSPAREPWSSRRCRRPGGPRRAGAVRCAQRDLRQRAARLPQRRFPPAAPDDGARVHRRDTGRASRRGEPVLSCGLRPVPARRPRAVPRPRAHGCAPPRRLRRAGRRTRGGRARPSPTR